MGNATCVWDPNMGVKKWDPSQKYDSREYGTQLGISLEGGLLLVHPAMRLQTPGRPLAACLGHVLCCLRALACAARLHLRQLSHALYHRPQWAQLSRTTTNTTSATSHHQSNIGHVTCYNPGISGISPTESGFSWPEPGYRPRVRLSEPRSRVCPYAGIASDSSPYSASQGLGPVSH